ncbi:MAG: hypothetical protein JXA07_05830 [Spirochaetes bacterium]|nr:hypothetical protein [Spirochaetota bacterium]
MKPIIQTSLFVLAGFLLSISVGCSQITGGLDDQAPVLFADIELTPDPALFPLDADHKIYLIYYSDSGWQNPWLIHGAADTFLVNPTVGTFTTYIAAFYDANGNGVLDTGDPCTGYNNALHTATTVTPLTKLTFIPLEWRTLAITLDAAVTYASSFAVTINQASVQPDPANAFPIAFTVVFGQAVDPATFTDADITDSGTAGGTTWTITDSGDHTNFLLTADTAGVPGTVEPSIAAGAVTDPAGNANADSTSTDNTVMYTP